MAPPWARPLSTASIDTNRSTPPQTRPVVVEVVVMEVKCRMTTPRRLTSGCADWSGNMTQTLRMG